MADAGGSPTTADSNRQRVDGRLVDDSVATGSQLAAAWGAAASWSAAAWVAAVSWSAAAWVAAVSTSVL
ncbi:MAG TPA: hypothetical protein VGG70_06850 [Candidatus Cybelea sp.]